MLTVNFIKCGIVTAVIAQPLTFRPTTGLSEPSFEPPCAKEDLSR